MLLTEVIFLSPTSTKNSALCTISSLWPTTAILIPPLKKKWLFFIE
jgi:hypothetical protein